MIPVKKLLFLDPKEYELHHGGDKVKWFFRRCLALSAKWSNRVVVYSVVITAAFVPDSREGIREILGFLGVYIGGNFTIQAIYMGAATYADIKEDKLKVEEKNR